MHDGNIYPAFPFSMRIILERLLIIARVRGGG